MPDSVHPSARLTNAAVSGLSETVRTTSLASTRRPDSICRQSPSETPARRAIARTGSRPRCRSTRSPTSRRQSSGVTRSVCHAYLCVVHDEKLGASTQLHRSSSRSAQVRGFFRPSCAYELTRTHKYAILWPWQQSARRAWSWQWPRLRSPPRNWPTKWGCR